MNIDPKEIENKMKKLLLTFVVILISTCSLCSQNKTIKGRVISNRLDTFNYVFIIINDTMEVGRANMNGFFKIDIPFSVQRILFKGPGFEPTLIKLMDKCDDVEIIMLSSSSDDYMSLKRSDRLRKKRQKQLPDLHKQAFLKGIFKTNKSCYTQEFIPYFKKTQK